MKRIIKQVGPFTAKARRDRFGTLAGSIVSQQISTSAAKTIWNRLLTAVEHKTTAAGRDDTQLTPGNLLLFNIDELREAGVSRQKATYLLDLAEKVDRQQVNLGAIGRLSDEDAIEQLIQVKGIGVWTAQMFLMFSLARLDVLPVDDLGIKNAVQKNYNLRKLPDASRITRIARPWRPYATVASWYLWQSLDLSG